MRISVALVSLVAGCANGGPKAIGNTGGHVDKLHFAVVGDTRPATEDDTAAYPSAVISTIFGDLAAQSPPPPFALSTGDYEYASPHGSQGAAQQKLYLDARSRYGGLVFFAMGNHECTGATASNCGAGTTDGLTNTYQAFLTMMLGPLGKTTPYYAIEVDANDGTWTSKLVFVAANAWDDAQASWLDATLALATTYTFIVRHESATATTAPGVIPSEAIMATHPYTLAIVGHTHKYEHSTSNPRQVIIGNGGAPLSTSQNYGYAIVKQRDDGAIQVDMFDYLTNEPDASFHFAVFADGVPAPP
jgi:hypothetical protein